MGKATKQPIPDPASMSHQRIFVAIHDFAKDDVKKTFFAVLEVCFLSWVSWRPFNPTGTFSDPVISRADSFVSSAECKFEHHWASSWDDLVATSTVFDNYGCLKWGTPESLLKFEMRSHLKIPITCIWNLVWLTDVQAVVELFALRLCSSSCGTKSDATITVWREYMLLLVELF